ncbi:transporter substrate-binding domain-containing protein [Labrys neptuniae]|uniref:Transporter substrate-binding domain-containing protein n=1 Tax=Labrys neptuniae TaxID=376174 RepID=A0ABV3PQW3_9HYPH
MRFVTFAAGALALMASMGMAHAKDWSTIKIGTEGAYPPFNSLTPSGEIVGFDVDIAKAVCEKLKAKCTVVAQDWDGIIPGLKAGKYDAIFASMSITDERKKQVDFSRSYYQTPAVWVAPKDSKVKSFDADGLKSSIVGTQSSTIHSNFLEGEIGPGGAQVKLYPAQDEANADLAAGRIDAVEADKSAMMEWLKSDAGKCCEIKAEIDIKKYVKYFGLGVGAAVRKEDTDLRDAISKAIEEIHADGTYKKLNEKYFPFDLWVP